MTNPTPQPRWMQQHTHGVDARWTDAELDELKAELSRRYLLDPLWHVCADAIGSLQFDIVDGRKP